MIRDTSQSDYGQIIVESLDFTYEDLVKQQLDSIAGLGFSDEYSKDALVERIIEVNRFAANSVMAEMIDFRGRLQIEVKAHLLASQVAESNGDQELSSILLSYADVLKSCSSFVSPTAASLPS